MPFSAKADIDPPDCTGSGLGIALFATKNGGIPADRAHVGDTVVYSVLVSNEEFPACLASGIDAWVETPDGERHDIELRRTDLEPGQSDFYEEIVTYEIREQDLQPGSEGRRRFASATAQVEGDIHQNETDSRGSAQQQVNTHVVNPCISVTQECVGQDGETGEILFEGTVTNCGDTPLVDVTVTLEVEGSSNPVVGPIDLDVGESVDFSDSFLPSEPCEAITSEVVATGTDTLSPSPQSVTDSATATCRLALNPDIDVTVECPEAPASPGENLIYTGTVENTGNVTLTDVEVVSNQPSAGTAVLNVDSLAPGESAGFTGEISVTEACEVGVRVNAGAQSICGTNVQTSSSVNCPIVTNPAIRVTKVCPEDGIEPGQRFTLRGTVENVGNVTLRRVRVESDFPSPGNVILADQNRLAPGESVEFTQQVRASHTRDVCAITETTTATGLDICTDEEVSDTAQTTCEVGINPMIEVTQNCPNTPTVPGEPVNFSGRVRNTGDVTLENVRVFSERDPGNELLRIESLPPGGSQSYSGSFEAPSNACSVDNTVVASGTSVCGNLSTRDEATATCPLQTNPRLEVNVECPSEPVLPGHPLDFTGTVENTGDVNLSDVVVVHRFEGEETEVIGPVTLAPGESTSFSGSFVPPEGVNDCSVTTTVEARGVGECGDVTTTDTASAECPLLTRPAIKVTSECPPDPVEQGSRLNYNGTVENTGNITLRDVVVFSERPEEGTRVFSVGSLEPGESADFSGRFQVPADCCSVKNTLRAEGTDICTDETVEDTTTSICPVVFEPELSITKECPDEPVAPGETLTYEGTIENTGNITMVDVVVRSDVPGAGDFLGPISLAPGETVSYVGSYTVPSGFCGRDTVTVEGVSLCGDTEASDSVTSACDVIANPRIEVTNQCPTEPLIRGETATFSGTVANTGDVDVEDVVVSNRIVLDTGDVSGESEVFGPVSIAAGETVSFSYEVTVPDDRECCDIVSTLTASGADLCGEAVSNSSTVVCPLQVQPNISVTVECPEEGLEDGAWVEYFGTVENTGDIALDDVSVVVNRAGEEEEVIGSLTLAAGETETFDFMFVKEGSGPLDSVVFTAGGTDICQGISVEDSADCHLNLGTAGVVSIDSAVSPSPGRIQLQWSAVPGQSYQVLACPDLRGDEWEVRDGNVVATESQVTWTDEMDGRQAQFYRIVVEE